MGKYLTKQRKKYLFLSVAMYYGKEMEATGQHYPCNKKQRVVNGAIKLAFSQVPQPPIIQNGSFLLG